MTIIELSLAILYTSLPYSKTHKTIMSRLFGILFCGPTGASNQSNSGSKIFRGCTILRPTGNCTKEVGASKIEFGWYLRKITLWAILGYTAGAVVYLVMQGLV